MYRGYLIEPLSTGFAQAYAPQGRALTESRRSQVERDLESYCGENGAIDAALLAKKWFPEIKADVFISHSHLDKELALRLVGWLKAELGLTAFVDSLVWGSADALLRKIDNNYCKNEDERSYNYKKRNLSTSHVHMMLAMAIAQMIDKCECLFFLSTPSSISAENTVNDKSQTSSPWLFAEIGLSSLVRKTPLSRERQLRLNEVTAAHHSISMDSIDVNYPLQLSHLTSINEKMLEKWRGRAASTGAGLPLDALYQIT
jgi:hypothetical protein